MNGVFYPREIEKRFADVYGEFGVEAADCMSNSQGVAIGGGDKLFVKWLMIRLFEQNFGKVMSPESRRCVSVKSEDFCQPMAWPDGTFNSLQRRKRADRRLSEALRNANAFTFATISAVPDGVRKCSCLLESWESHGGKWRIRLGNSIVKVMFEAARRAAAENKRKGGGGE